jgi:hypothetical protein
MRRAVTWGILVILIGLALASRALIGGEDWNGFVSGTWVAFFWIAMSLCVDKLRPARRGLLYGVGRSDSRCGRLYLQRAADH